MSIVPSNIKSGLDLIRQMNLEGVEYPHLNTESFLISVFSIAKEIWANDVTANFTDHSIIHSLRIISYFDQLDKCFSWTNYEKVIFITAALIHDIGMQFNNWAPAEITSLGFLQPPLSQDVMRKNHASICNQLVKSQIAGIYHFSSPPHFPTATIGEKNAISTAAFIAACHSGKSQIGELMVKRENWKTKHKYGEKFRPTLLAGILRLCDEFDGNIERIPHPERFNVWDVNEVSKRHWLACIFVENTELEITNDVVSISLQWQVHESASEREKTLIKRFLDSTRILKINSEIMFVEDTFKNCQEFFGVEFRVNPLSDSPSECQIPYNKEIEKIINDSLSLPVTDLGMQSGLAREAKLETNNGVEIGVKEEYETLESELLSWFDMNKEPPGHYELLASHEHTSVYVNCRRLISNQSLIRRISRHIVEFCKTNKCEINCVLAVGTTAIPIAINVAYQLHTSVTFTISRIENGVEQPDSNKILEALKRDYSVIELLPTSRKGDNVLIIDDIISVGLEVRKIIDNLEAINKKPNQIYYQSIFRLGNKELFFDPRIGEKNYSWIVQVDSIYYSTQNVCELCDLKIPIKSEKDMY